MEKSLFKPELEKKLLWIVFAVYVVCILFGVMHHEPWRDESQSWLVTRDNSFIELFKVLPSEGHPPLWYLVLTPFVKAGIPYEFQNWLAGAFMIAGVFVILFHTKAHIITKLLIPFSYFFLFEYGLFARSYCLAVFFLSLIISLYPKRFDKPVLFALCVGALFNTHMLMFAFAASLTGMYLLDAVQYKKFKGPVIGAFALMCILGLYLFPYIGMADTADIFVPEIKNVWKEITRTIGLGLLTEQSSGFAVLVFIALCIPLITRTKPILLLLGGCAGLFYILGVQFIGSIRHTGILFLIIFTVYAIAQYYKEDALNYVKSNNIKPEYGYWVFALVIIMQLNAAIGNYSDDIKRVYSDSKNAAQYILDHNLENHIIAAHSAAYACTILPYLPADKRMYYPEYPRYGSYYTNDSFYVNRVWDKPEEYYINVVKQNFKGRMDSVIFVFNHSISPKVAATMEPLYMTKEETIFPFEMFIVCRLKKEFQQ